MWRYHYIIFDLKYLVSFDEKNFEERYFWVKINMTTKTTIIEQHNNEETVF